MTFSGPDGSSDAGIGAEVRGPRARRHPGDLDEGGLEPWIADACPGGEPLPCAFILPRMETRAGHQVSGCWKPAHVDDSATMRRATVRPTAGIVISRPIAA
jgi:hypothetical protein